MINPQWHELPKSQINFHGLKDVQAIEVLWYIFFSKGDNLNENTKSYFLYSFKYCLLLFIISRLKFHYLYFKMTDQFLFFYDYTLYIGSGEHNSQTGNMTYVPCQKSK